MKIAISGAHKVGKTTLAEDLFAHLPGYELYSEPYYELEESGYLFSAIPVVDDFIRQFEYSVKQIRNSGPDVLFDRCPIDILAYIHAIDRGMNIESMFETAQTVCAEIDLLVFVSIENPDVISSEITDWPKIRYKVNDTLDTWIGEFGIHAIEVSGSLSNRREQVLNSIALIAGR